MPSVQYYNNSAPFWDFIASMEEQHNNNNANTARGQDEEHQQANPWTEGWGGFPFGPFPHRPRHHHGGPPPPHARGHGHHHGPGRHEGPPGTPPPEGDSETEAGPSNDRGPAENTDGEEHRPGHGRGRHAHGHRGPGGRCDPRMRGGHGRGGFGGRGGHFGGGRGRFHPYAGPFGAFAQLFQEGFGEQTNNKNEDFTPEADVFDTPSAFIVHVSLPGAKKEDVGVNWENEKSELSIAGVTYRPGDEEFLKTLAMDERKVGPFERKVRLGSRASPAQVDVEGITARLEDGVLTVEVPKLNEGEFVEVKKVDIE